MSLNFLLASWGNPGNLNPVLTAARQLKRRGHRVRILDIAAHQEETEQAGFESLPWRRPPALQPCENGGDPFWAEVEMLMEQVTFGTAIDYARDTVDALRREPADAVLTNDLVAGPAIAAEALGIPYALLSPHIGIRPVEDIPYCFDGSIPGQTAGFETAEQAGRARFANMMGGYLSTLNRARAAFGLAPLGHIFDHYDRAERVLLGISAAFDFPSTCLPANLRYVGPLLDPPAWAQSWKVPRFASSWRPRILVSLSTSFQNQADLLRRIIALLGPLDLDAIVTTGPAMKDEAFDPPANVVVVTSAPHDAVMKEVSLVITHGGHGTVSRALLNHVPLLVLPMGRDQGSNAARIASRGAGLALSDSATNGEIAFAISRLLTDPQFRRSATQLGEAMANDMSASVVAMEMEDIVARHEQCHCQARNPISSMA